MPSTADTKNNFIPLKEAAIISGYTKDHIGRLSRARKIEAKMDNDTWLVNPDSLLQYKNEATLIRQKKLKEEAERNAQIKNQSSISSQILYGFTKTILIVLIISTLGLFFGTNLRSILIGYTNNQIQSIFQLAIVHDPLSSPQNSLRFTKAIQHSFELQTFKAGQHTGEWLYQKGLQARTMFAQWLNSLIPRRFTQLPLPPPPTKIRKLIEKEGVLEVTEPESDIEKLQQEIAFLKSQGFQAQPTIVERSVVERIVERILSGFSQEDLDLAIQALNNKLLQEVADLKSLITKRTQSNFQAIALTNRIDNLSNVTLASPTITGGTFNLTDADIPNDITIASSNALSATSGSFSGILSVTGTATSTIAGLTVFTKVPSIAHTFGSWSPGVATSSILNSSLLINPVSAVADTVLFAIAVNDASVFMVDAEGDVFVRNLTATGTVNQADTIMSSLTVENNTTLGDAIGDTVTFNAGTLTFATSTFVFNSIATSTIPDLTVNAWSIATSTSIVPTFTISTISSPFGRVGIGTTSPVESLATAGLFYAGGSGTSTIENNLAILGALQIGNSSLYIDTNSIENLSGNLILQSTSGNVGIGTTTPGGVLAVNNIGSGLSFIVSDQTDPDPTPFVIDGAGNIGIGTANPNAKLVVDTFASGFAMLVESTFTDLPFAGGISALSGVPSCGFLVGKIAIYGCGSGQGVFGESDGSGGYGIHGKNDVADGYAGYFEGRGYFSDNLGIGTTSPYARLSVESGDAATTTLALRPITSQTANIIDIYDTSGILTSVLTQDHKLGIGTTSPIEKLTLTGGSFFQAGGDATTQYTPTEVGGVEIGNSVGNPITGNPVYVSGNYAYVVNNVLTGTGCSISDPSGCEFRIYDVSTSTPSFVNGMDLGQTGYRVFVSGDYAYIGKDNLGIAEDFIIYDISNPSNIATTSALDLSEAVYDVYVSGRYAYLVTSLGANEFRIYDVSDPTNPIEVGGVDLNVAGYNVYVSGKYAYVTTGANASGNEFRIFEISDPTNPFEIGSVEMGATTHDVYVSGTYVYIVKGNAGISEDFVIYDISDPTNIATTTAIDLNAPANDIYVSGRYAYIGTDGETTNQEFLIYDVFDPYNVVQIANVDTTDDVNGVFVKGNRAYLGLDSSASTEFRVFNITGIEVQSALVYSFEAGNAQIHNDLIVGGHLYGDSLNLGLGGLFSRGPISAFVASTTQTNAVSGTFMGGNVGIGTTSPNALLTLGSNSVAGSMRIYSIAGSYTPVIDLATSTLNRGMQILRHTDLSNFWAVKTVLSGQNLGLFVDNTPTKGIYIQTGGNVGIGTTNPDSLLHISNSGSLNESIRLGYWNSTNYSDIDNLLPGSTFGSLVQGGDNAHVVVGLKDNDNADAFSVVSGGGNYMTDTTYDTVVFYAGADGNVGIGTTSPFEKLSLQDGDIFISKTNALRSEIGGGNSYINLISSQPADISTEGADAIVVGDDTAVNRLEFHTTNTTHFFRNGSEIMTIGNSGQLGIDDLSPDFKLEIATTTGSGYFGVTSAGGSNGDIFIINSSGNVGIGVTPTAELHVKSNSATAHNVFLVQANDGGSLAIIKEESNSRATLRLHDDAGNEDIRFDTGGDSFFMGGEVGIGITNPSDFLHIKSATTNTRSLFIEYTDNTGVADIGLFEIDSASTFHPFAVFMLNSVDKFVFGNTGIGNCRGGTGCWTESSDVALKENIRDLDYGLETVLQLKPRRFNLKASPGEKSFGLIAQEVEDIIPELVSGEEGNKAIGYGALTSVLVKAIQEQQVQIKDMATSIEELESKMQWDYVQGETQISTSTLEMLAHNTEDIIAHLLDYLETLGVKIVQGIVYLKEVVVDKLTVTEIYVKETLETKRVTAQELCLEDVCVNKEQLKILLTNAGIENVKHSVFNNNSTTTITATTTSVSATTTLITTTTLAEGSIASTTVAEPIVDITTDSTTSTSSGQAGSLQATSTSENIDVVDETATSTSDVIEILEEVPSIAEQELNVATTTPSN